ncbi:hypothetical protein POKO110462_16875 [Pontibacter korlensis]|uniref:DUF2938 domain-containing protein n=1 Tax=Pontibacter korlensis TaxID=400092 RepID=A0A0E3ZF61_9BACT|nr:hypothetical protein [Pontibacter korlensis]AKD03340.1 hypothetical protein PKOR_09670 [Pontibacter korlensis]
MKFFDAVLAGIAGTAAMTAFLYLLSFITHRVMKVVCILGTMLLNRTQPDGSLSELTSTKVAGTIAHYGVGVLFALIYLALWSSGVGLPTASWGLLFGLAHGLVAMVVWYFFFMMHPNPPLITLRTYLTTLIFAHIIFGFVATYTFYLLVRPDYSFWW